MLQVYRTHICIAIVSTMTILYTIYILKRHTVKLEKFIQSDVEFSVLDNIPTDILDNNNVSVSTETKLLNIFITKDAAGRVYDKKTIGYLFDSDLKYLNRFRDVLEFQFNAVKISSLQNVTNNDYFFIKLTHDEDLFTELNSKYILHQIKTLNKQNIQFRFPLSEIQKVINKRSNDIVLVVAMPNIVINNENISVDEKKTSIYNSHIGKRQNSHQVPEKQTNFLNEWWTDEQFIVATVIDFPITNYEFKETESSQYKKLIIKDDLYFMIGDRIILFNQFDENLNDYYYVHSVGETPKQGVMGDTPPITLFNYLKSTSLDKIQPVNNDRMLKNNQLLSYSDGQFVKSPQVIQSKQKYADCVDKDDYTLATDFATKEACESDYDAFGNKRINKNTMWYKRCKNNSECKYNSIATNKLKGLCTNGLCEEPLTDNNGNILYYGNNKQDLAFANDTQDRIQQKMKPILNI